MSADISQQLMFWGNLGTAVAYFVIAGQLVLFVNSPQVMTLFPANDRNKDGKIRHMYRLMMAVATLFSSFICMCGLTHLMNVVRHLHPHNQEILITQSIVMLVCAIISIVTAIIGFQLFPAVAEVFQKFELGNDGSLQHSENYLIEVVEMLKESILVLTDDLLVVRCNDISRSLFGASLISTRICDYIKKSDLPMFKDTIQRVTNSYSFVPVTTEVRIRRNTPSNSPNQTPQTVKQKKKTKPTFQASSSAIESSSINVDTPLQGAASSEDDEDFIWIEVTMCKGKQVRSDTGGFEYDLKLVCRDIDDHKKRQAYQALIESSEERDRINESKLRYLSCIAHDLKTPLQSFSFSLDLLDHTDLHPEQREFVQQANVAVDLMKLTISQTMDISKALTGAKLMPRRTTVYLSSVLNRVKIIINGYGKQVPVSFEVPPDVCDEIITDEEWLWQMLLNLLTNACKYTDRGSIRVRISVVDHQGIPQKDDCSKKLPLPPLVVPHMTPSTLLCEVIDTGVGISPTKIGQVFDAFAQVQEGQVTGTGLGLFGVRTRAEGLLGTCGARHNTESSTGTGTVLWFAIPYTPNIDLMNGFAPVEVPSTLRLSPNISYSKCISPLRETPQFSSPKQNDSTLSSLSAPTSAVSVPSQPISTSAPSGDLALTSDELIRRLHLSAILVEDTATVRKLMERLLLKMGFASVKGYENGSKGLEAMMAAPVDIVFSDVQMPIMTGPEMVSRFRKWESDQRQQAHQASPSHADAPFETQLSPFASPVCNADTSLLSGLNQPNPLLVSGVDGGVRTKGVRPRQLIVAVTANGAECGECGENGFDEICPKPLTKTDIYRIVSRFFQ